MSEKALIGAAVIGQSGGPSSVINSSAYGVIKTALENENITKVYGAFHGIKGVLNDQLMIMDEEDPAELANMLHTPSSALGSCRYKIADPDTDDTDYKRILEIFKKYNIRYFFYNGGNDSMDTCNKISKYMSKVGYACRVMGVPKTIDNDLAGTDHCPGFASAAKYIATSVMEVSRDSQVYDTGMITVVECMGRHAGWLTAAASLANISGQGPDLIYLPETVFSLDRFVEDVKRCYEEKGACIVAISEGVHDENGTFIAEYASKAAGATDAFGHKQMGGAAAFLAAELNSRLGVKTRGLEFSLLQRCGAHVASKTDVEEAVLMGREAVKAAVAGVTDKMVAIQREEGCDEYRPSVKLVDLTVTANTEHKFPLEWITNNGTGISPEFAKYALPLIQGAPDYQWENGLPRFAQLKKVLVK